VQHREEIEGSAVEISERIKARHSKAAVIKGDDGK
jgi:hypothetical protein